MCVLCADVFLLYLMRSVLCVKKKTTNLRRKTNEFETQRERECPFVREQGSFVGEFGCFVCE